MNKKKILFIVLGILVLVSVMNFTAGTTIMINGKQVTSPVGFIAAYLGLVVLAILMVILIPSVLLLAVVLAVLFGLFFVLFFPLMPIAFLLMPGIIFVGIVLIVYRLVKKNK